MFMHRAGDRQDVESGRRITLRLLLAVLSPNPGS
jgi:hypothetical protein